MSVRTALCFCGPGMYILQTYVCVFVGTEDFWGTRILDLPFVGCVVLGKGLTLSGPGFLFCNEPRAGARQEEE